MISALVKAWSQIAGTPLPFSAWYGARSRREQVLLQIAAGALLAFVYYTAVYRPLTAQRDAALMQIAQYDAALRQLSSLPAEDAAQASTDTSVPLATLVTDTAALHGLTIRRLEPGDQSVSLVIDDAAADALFGWLDALAKDNGVTATAVSLERRTAPGVVSATLTFARVMQ